MLFLVEKVVLNIHFQFNLSVFKLGKLEKKKMIHDTGRTFSTTKLTKIYYYLVVVAAHLTVNNTREDQSTNMVPQKDRGKGDSTGYG